MSPRILAVDDDPVNLSIIRATFEDAPYQFQFAASGSQALALLNDESSSIDLVILDRMMPGMDGMEVLRRIKTTPRLAATPVVMQTAAAGPRQVEEGLRAGAYYYLTKPYSPAALRTIVGSALEDGQRRGKLGLRTPAQLNALQRLDRGTFSARTLEDVDDLTELLSALCPDPASVWTALRELLTNAVEHGNLAISYAEKTQLKLNERWREEVDRRAELPEYRERRVQVTFERRLDALRFEIADEGLGFPWRSYLDFDPARAFDPNGRGIALARALCFQDLHYEGCGNLAIATLRLPG